MTYYITALTNDVAKLIVSETRTTDATVADLVDRHLTEQGFVVVRRRAATSPRPPATILRVPVVDFAPPPKPAKRRPKRKAQTKRARRK